MPSGEPSQVSATRWQQLTVFRKSKLKQYLYTLNKCYTSDTLANYQKY